jgi:hypothetical protein
MPAGGGVIQIAAQGRQNEHLNSDPEFTLFKTQHQRFTNFAEDFEENPFSAGSVGFGQRVSATISRYGDLVSDILLEIELPAIGAAAEVNDSGGLPVADADKAAYWVNAIGFAIIDEVELEIGGTEVDTVYSEWLWFWEELTQRPGARLQEQIGKFSNHPDVEEDMIEFARRPRNLYVPLPFWFNKYYMEKGLCIPLISLTYHEIRIKVHFRPLSECYVCVNRVADATWGDVWMQNTTRPINLASGTELKANEIEARMLVSYVYLDEDERAAFASVEHEYLITTIQRQTQSITSANAASDQVKLYFNHPSNLLNWNIRPNDWMTERRRASVGWKDRFDYSLKLDVDGVSMWGDSIDPVKGASLTLNGHDRFPSGLPGIFFRSVQPAQKWENVPKGYMYIFTFASQGGVWNPTSSLNFSKIDHVQLNLTYNSGIPTSEVIIFVESYNLLVIKEGMGGVRYSN